MVKLLRNFFILIVAVLPFAARAQPVPVPVPVEILASQSGHPIALGLLIDRETYEHTREAVLRYRDALEAEGLSVSVIQGAFSTPEEVKAEIRKLYEGAKPLEGVVLIGKIPEPMLEITGNLLRSDRFYDDLSLEFEYIGPDERNPLRFHYRLAGAGGTGTAAGTGPTAGTGTTAGTAPERPWPAFYSARIPYLQSLGDRAFGAIGTFLDKAAAARQHGPLDHLVTYTGSNVIHMQHMKPMVTPEPDCLTAWQDREKAYRELFPLAFRPGGSARQLHHRMARTTQGALIAAELERPEVDLFLLNRLGPWKEIQDIPAQSRVMLLDYTDIGSNGPTGVEAEGVSRFIFNNGQTLAVQGNFKLVTGDHPRLVSAGDTWSLDLAGILGRGVRIGQLQRLNATWENLLIGDPTFRFGSDADPRLADDLTLRAGDEDTWLNWLSRGRAAEDPVLQSLALRMLADQDAARGGIPNVGPILVRTFADELYDVFRESPFHTVRLQALTLLNRYPGLPFTNAVAAGLLDPYEQIARQASLYAGPIGDPVLLPAMVEAMVFHGERKRVVFHLHHAIRLFPIGESKSLFAQLVGASNRITKDREIAEFNAQMDQLGAWLGESLSQLTDATADPEQRITGIVTKADPAGNPYHVHVDAYLDILMDKDEALPVRVAVAKVLGESFRYSYTRERIVYSLQSVLKERRLPATLRMAAETALDRLDRTPYR